uniref:ZP domain-containing protein n=1 Tax=Romanomermis culicivorax TaxID=13658 RepID=A0A915JG41_ROMCU
MSQHSNDAKIGRCWATDGESEIQLSDDEGCTIQTSNNIWNNFRTVIDANENNNDSSRTLINEIKTWAFPTSNRVNIYCNLHICSPLCSNGPCPSKLTSPESSANAKNKILKSKRAIEDGPNNETSADHFSDPFLEKTVRLKFGYSVKSTNFLDSKYSRILQKTDHCAAASYLY